MTGLGDAEPTAHSEWLPGTVVTSSRMPFTRGWNTTLHAWPFHFITNGCRKLRVPTAQALVAERAATARSSADRCRVGVGLAFQLAPSQCRISGCRNAGPFPGL